MKISAEKRLFWFFKDGVKLNIKDQRYLDMYVQQVLSHGRTSDIKKLMKEVDLESLKKSLERIKGYLPKRVRNFWEDMLGDTRQNTTEDPGFDLYWFATALEIINEFPPDAPDMLIMLEPCTIEELRIYYNTWKRDIFKEITGDSLGQLT